MSTIIVQKHSFHESRRKKEIRDNFCVDNLQSLDLIDFVNSNLKLNVMVQVPNKERSFNLQRSTSVTSRSLFMAVQAGPSGLEGAVYDAQGNHTLRIDRSDSTTHTGRVFFVAPERQLYAYSFYERHPGNTPGLDVFAKLRSTWRDQYGAQNSITWLAEWCQFGNEFLADIKFKGLEVRKKNQSISIEGQSIPLGRVSRSITPRRGKLLPKALADKIIQGQIKAHDVLNWDADEGDEQILDLQGSDGVTKRYVVERGDLPKLQVKIDSTISDEDFISECRMILRSLEQNA